MKTPYVLGACPICATQESQVISGRGAGLAELEALWEGVDRPLPVADTLSFTQPPALAVVRCRGCGLLYRNPRERDVRALYELEPVSEQRLGELRAAQVPAFLPIVRRLTALQGGTGRGVEVGSYAGAFLAAAAAAGWHFHGRDVNPRTVAFLRRCGHDVSVGGIEDCAPAGSLDVVACWNTFEQLPDPRAAALAAHRLLRPGGLFALRVPNGAYYLALRPRLDGPTRRVARGLLARHNFLGFPYRHGFTTAALRRLLDTAGFDLVRMAPALVLPNGRAVSRGLDALERALRPLTGPPWLELWARARR